MTPTNISQTTEAAPNVNRRRFLLNAATTGAAVAVATPIIAAQPERTAIEQAWWHIRELERLTIADGGKKPIIIIQATYGREDYRGLGINVHGREVNSGMFAEGGAA